MKQVVKGFLLIEACIGLSMMVIFGSLLFNWCIRLSDTQRYCKDVVKALCLARSTIEQMRIGKQYSPTFSTEQFHVQIDKQRALHVDHYTYVTVTVTSQKVNNKPIVTLKTGLCL